MEKSKAPRDLAIDKSKHKFYEDLKAGKLLPELKGYEFAYLFIIAMAYGVYYNKRKPIPSKSTKRSIPKYVSLIEKEFEWLIKAIAINYSKEGLNVIPNEAEIYKIVEEYANGGIEIIEKILKESRPGEFKIIMERELNKIQKNEK